MKIVIPMAGAGSRFRDLGYDLPKPLIEVAGKTLIEHSIRSFDVPGEFIFITRKFDNPEHNAQLSKLLKQLRPEHVEIQLDKVTSGASETVLAARELIDNSEPLIIYNCDQIFDWNPDNFLQFVTPHMAGAVVCYKSTDPKNSFAVIEQDKIVRMVEKQPVSDHALVGFHYWREGRLFVESADALLQQFRLSGRPECYISETYNYLIDQGHHVAAYHVAPHVYVSLGTPADVQTYVGKQKEFVASKPKTIFCDIDGTIFKHAHSISAVYAQPAQLLTGVRQKFDQWDLEGHHIVLTTARKPSARAITEQQLATLGIAYDQLIMGVTSGNRVLINDKLQDDHADRAQAVNVITDASWQDVNWKACGL